MWSLLIIIGWQHSPTSTDTVWSTDHRLVWKQLHQLYYVFTITKFNRNYSIFHQVQSCRNCLGADMPCSSAAFKSDLSISELSVSFLSMTGGPNQVDEMPVASKNCVNCTLTQWRLPVLFMSNIMSRTHFKTQKIVNASSCSESFVAFRNKFASTV